jgi:hypothetical protein
MRSDVQTEGRTDRRSDFKQMPPGGGGAVKATQNQELPCMTHSTQNYFNFLLLLSLACSDSQRTPYIWWGSLKG